MRSLFLIVIFLLVGSFLKAQDYCSFLERIISYQHSVDVIYNLKKPPYDSAYINKSTFDFNHYLSLFDKLKVKEGYLIDCQFLYMCSAAWPVLYARKVSLNFDSLVKKRVKRYKNIKDEIFKKNRSYEYARWCNSQKDWFARDSVNSAWQYLIPEDSKEGYFQFLSFYLTGDKFAHWWHANFGYHFIMCDKKRFEALISLAEKKIDVLNFDISKAQRLLKRDFSPEIEMLNDKCLVTIYLFIANGGVYYNKYEISREKPYSIKQIGSQLLLDNNYCVF